MRTATAWIVGITIFLSLAVLANLLGKVIGVPVQLHFDEPIVMEHRLYDEEKDSAFTTFGLATTIICGMLASRVGMAISYRSWHGDLEPKGEIQFLTWLMGLCIYAVIGVLLFLASRGVHNSFANFLFNALDLGFAAGIAWVMKHWHDQRVANLLDLSSDKGQSNK